MQTEITFHSHEGPPEIAARYVREAQIGFARLNIGAVTVNFFAEDFAGARERFRDLRAALDRAEREFLEAEAPALAELRPSPIAAEDCDEAAAEFTARRVNEQLGSAA